MAGSAWVSMATKHEEIYKTTPHALGDANNDVLAFFAKLDAGLVVLDVGCGQGRDALTRARAGHVVHGVDIAPDRNALCRAAN